MEAMLRDIRSNHYKIPAAIAESRPLPFSVGSYFSMPAGPWSIPILNMRTEEFQKALDERLHDGRVWVRTWHTEYESTIGPMMQYWGCINDGRIPKDWYSPKLLWIGSAIPTIEIATEIIAFHGSDPDEIDQFIKPHEYWEKRGGHYEMGSVSFKR
jgi:hypothetical protein